MTQIQKLKACDWTLLVLLVLIAASGIQLEVTHGESPLWVWLHIVAGSLFLGFCAWHVWLHFKRSDWFARFRKIKSQWTRLLWWTSIIVLLTAIAATIHWLSIYRHSPIGGIHGKLGFLMVILAAAHAAKRRKFYSR